MAELTAELPALLIALAFVAVVVAAWFWAP